MLNHPKRGAFTLIELLVVIMIIAVLMGLAFPAFQKVQESAKKTQAKNDLVQMVTAVNAFYTEYGKYPSGGSSGDKTFAADNDLLFNVLRGIPYGAGENPRQIAFLEARPAKNQQQPRGGIGGDGRFYDPFGMPYSITVDGDYDRQLANPYENAGGTPLTLSVISFSSGKNKAKDGDAKGSGFDDVLSWQ